MATAPTQDARAEQAMSGAVNQMMQAATAEKAAAAKPTAITLTVDVADRTALTRSQATALNRARLALKGPFDVSLAWGGSEEAGEVEAGGEEPESGGQAAA